MKKRIILALLFTLCLWLAALPAMAAPGPQLLFQSGTGPELPSPVGFPIGPTAVAGDMIPGVSWNCPFADCNVEGMSIFAFVDQPTGGPPTPTSVQVQLSRTSFDFSDNPTHPSFGFTVPGSAIFGIGPCLPTDTAICIQELSLNFHHSYDFPGGTNWISLLAMMGNGPSHTFWSNANITPTGSQTLSLDLATGGVSGYPSSLAFAVFGTPTPEPSSILMLGSGILGLAGLLRRKLMR